MNKLGVRGLLAVWCLSGLGHAWGAVSFLHKDWELACDNTGTCRAAGYQRDQDHEAPVSVLLTRVAGPGAAVSARVMLGNYDDQAPVQSARLVMSINGTSHGPVPTKGENLELTRNQVSVLLKSLLGTGEIVFSSGQHRWRLSGDGAAAVLLKMDETQGRLGTPSALVRKGDASEDQVALPVTMPVVNAVRRAPTLPNDAKLGALILPHLKVPDDDDCYSKQDPGEPPRIWRLNARKVLVSTQCWLAAYNQGFGFWVANDKPPYQPRLVTTRGSEFDEVATIHAAHKGRGLGDCWSSDQWVWNGQDFVHTSSLTTGMCKLVAPGGAWELPTLVTDVRPPQ